MKGAKQLRDMIYSILENSDTVSDVTLKNSPNSSTLLLDRADGKGRMTFHTLFPGLAGPGTAEWGCRWVGISTALAAASGTAWLVWRTGGSFWLLPAVMGLLLAGVGWRNDR